MYAIIKLQAENFMGLKAVSIAPDGNVVEITGKEGQGKSSVLRAIWAALGGKDAFPKQPIRKGQDSAAIAVNLGDGGKTTLKVRLRFTAQEDGSFTHSLIVENGEGARFNKPQTMLNGLIGALSFDPMAFALAKPDAQIDMLKGLVTGYDFKEQARLNEEDFRTRTDVNRQAKALRTRAEGIEIPAGAPKARVDDKALLDEYADAGAKNARLSQQADNRRKLRAEADEFKAKAHSRRVDAMNLRERADALDREAKEAEREAEAVEAEIAELKPMPDPVDVTDLRRRMDEAASQNRLFDAAQAAREQEKALTDEAKGLEARSAALTAAIEARDKAKAAAIAKAKLPVEGLDFGADEITLDGVPFSQVNTAARLRTSFAIAAALNPELRVIRVEQGAFLDRDGFATLAKMAKETNMQVWVETIDSSRPAAIVIEEGEVAS